MKRILALLLVLASLLCAVCAFAEGEAQEPAQDNGYELTTEYRWFVNKYRTVRGYTVTYYDDVYAYNHGDYYLTPFDSTVPAEYLIKDESGAYAVAPIVLMLVLFIFIPALNAGTVGIMVPVSVLFTIGFARILYKKGVL
jgi:hypothetical protein